MGIGGTAAAAQRVRMGRRGGSSPLGGCQNVEGGYAPAARLESPDWGALGGGSGKPDLESGLLWIEEVVGQRAVPQRLEQEVGEEGEGGDRVDEVAAREQLHEQMRDLEQQIQVRHDVEVVAVTEVLQFVAGFLFVESFVFNGPSLASSLGNNDDVISLDAEVRQPGKGGGLAVRGLLAHEEVQREAFVFEVVDPGVLPAHAMTLGAGGLGDAVVGIEGLEGEGFLVQRGDGTGLEAADELVLDGVDGLEHGAIAVSGIEQVNDGLEREGLLEARQQAMERLGFAVLFVVFAVGGIELHLGHDR